MTYPEETNPAPYTEPNIYPKKRKVWPWIVGGLLLLFLCVGGTFVACTAMVGGAVSEIDKELKENKELKTKQVEINKCTKTDFGFVEIRYTVTNDFAEEQSYLIQFEIKDADGVRTGEAHAALNNIAAGTTAKDKAVSIAEVGTKKFTCSIVSVD